MKSVFPRLKATLVDSKLPIIVILGMHRSGTSLVANLVHALGVDLGLDLQPANEWNSAGYWESRQIMKTHEKILKELNCEWHNPPFSFPADWQRKPEIQQLKSGLREFVRSECERTDTIWGFKDPRTAILLPLWQEIFDELQLEPHYILVVRHPGPVAASLSRRDRLVFSHSQMLWLKTYLHALSHTGNRLRAIVDYDRWFDSGLQQAGAMIKSLNLSQSISEQQIANAVNDIIQPPLRHHCCKQDAICSPAIEGFYSLLLQTTINGKVPDEIRAITETFEKAADLLTIWDDLLAERDAAIAEQNAAIAEQNATIANRDAAIAERGVKIARLRKQRRLFIYIIISIVAVFSLISLFMLSYHNWF